MFFQNSLRSAVSTFLFATLLGLSATRAAQSWELLPQAEVDSQGIFADRLFAEKSAESHAQIRLANAPAWGESRRLTRDDVLQLLAKATPDFNANLTGAPQVTITRRAEKLTEKDLIIRLTNELMKNREAGRDGELELRVTREWKPIPIPAEDVELRIIDRPASGLASNLMIRFEIRSSSGSELIGTYTVFLQARLIREVWVARSAIKRGTSMDAADLAQERRDVVNLQAPWLEDSIDSTCQFKESVPAGGIVFARAVQRRPVVLKGQLAQATVKDDLLSISTKLELLEDGVPGQMVKARNPRTKKVLQGKVMNDGSIEILF